MVHPTWRRNPAAERDAPCPARHWPPSQERFAPKPAPMAVSMVLLVGVGIPVPGSRLTSDRGLRLLSRRRSSHCLDVERVPGSVTMRFLRSTANSRGPKCNTTAKHDLSRLPDLQRLADGFSGITQQNCNFVAFVTGAEESAAALRRAWHYRRKLWLTSASASVCGCSM